MFSHAALNATLNGTSAILLAGGYAAIRNGKIAPQEVHDRGVCCINGLPDLLPRLPLSGGTHSLSGPGLDPSRLFYAVDLAHNTGNCNRATDPDYDSPRLAGEIRQTSHHCPVDISALDVRIGHRRDRLSLALHRLLTFSFYSSGYRPSQWHGKVKFCNSMPWDGGHRQF